MLRQQMVPLLIADVRAELTDVQTMAPESASGEDISEIAARLDTLETRATDIESALDSFETPVSWAAVKYELERARRA
ncbi:hypothetical protein [Haloferax sp. DFSO60]|uniref:hypothetical protein n=1 Tax=Haloferax sp. DFSO60 TaxID=3388652 RepID=UPI00397A794E